MQTQTTAKRYSGESPSTRRGSKYIRRSDPLKSEELSDFELLEAISGSRKFAREFIELRGSYVALFELSDARELLVFPTATETVIDRVWSHLEGVSRCIKSQN